MHGDQSLLEPKVFHLLLAFFFVGMNAFFVAAEFALVKIRATRLEILVRGGNPVARIAQGMVDRLDPYLSATKLGITLASLGLGWVGEPAFAKLFFNVLSSFNLSVSPQAVHSVAFAVAFAVISGMHIILGELVPKSIAIRTAEKICLLIAIPLRIFYLVFFPLLWILNSTSNLILKLMRFKPVGGPGRAHSEEEIKLIVEASFEEGEIGPQKRFLLDKAIDFSHKRLRGIIVPRDKMICFDLKDSLHDNLTRAKQARHTRFPLDDRGRIIGYVHMKDVIWGLEHGDVINLFDLAHPILTFSEEMRLDQAFVEFQSKRTHIALVTGGGKLLGMVTLEDVIEELVGEIEDEFDRGSSPSHPPRGAPREPPIR